MSSECWLQTKQQIEESLLYRRDEIERLRREIRKHEDEIYLLRKKLIRKEYQ